MYEAHPLFKQPENEDVKVWRCMDFTKFVSLLDSQCLYFTRVDKFNDPFEGSWPQFNVLARQCIPEGIPENARDSYLKAMTNMGEINRQWLKFHAINCWHMNEHESAAMWKLYLKSDEGIAIQSTYKKLKDSLIDEERIFLSIVNYIDYDNECLNYGIYVGTFCSQTKEF